MTSDDDWQVTTVVLRLKRAVDTLLTFSNPITAAAEIISIVNDLASILRDVPGNPDTIDGYAVSFRAMATALDSAGTDISSVARGQVPAVWQGKAAEQATGALTATRDLLEQAAPAMRTAATLLDDYADTLRRLKKDLSRHRGDLSDAVHELDSVLDIGANILDSVIPGGDDGMIGELRKIISALRGAITVFESLGEAADRVRRGMRDVSGKARAGAIRGPYVSAFEAVRLADAGISGGARGENGILTTAQLKLASEKLDALSPEDRAKMLALLDNAGSEAEKAYLLKALAAGHTVAEVDRFGSVIHGKDEAWLRKQLSLVNPSATGSVTYDGFPVDQFDGTTCGSTSIMLAHAMSDPLYAMSLTTDDTGKPLPGDQFYQRISAEEQRIHDRSNTVWPQSLGTSPWGLSDEMDSLGTDYDWRLVDDTNPGSVNPALDDAVGAVDAGYTVPVLIGDGYPAHYVLLVGHEGSDLIFYDPSGKMTRVSESDFRDGNMSALGYPHVQGVVAPK